MYQNGIVIYTIRIYHSSSLLYNILEKKKYIYNRTYASIYINSAAGLLLLYIVDESPKRKKKIRPTTDMFLVSAAVALS